MLTDELHRPQPHEVHARGVRPGAPPPSWGGETRGKEQGSARTVHRLRRIRQVSVEAITEIDQALQHGTS
ncbi:hypothetical protein [Nonomuraea gerenzanensis]|uniref:Uncharacterized protein n=1 Tax=Nonomuraea gerenzanensis TaxID=93944 RepID=A0A1M4EKA2_9ACTN|nr:hypothetical protein [Nonomuraea gerenzanensis]UBU10867.1 hypothetical protein LCN96_42090 [Nonomuraea gerenzanensis]SBO99302.1 hypothetical protein BN4615_P8818 [Nonomuraea gerenzanensis]